MNTSRYGQGSEPEQKNVDVTVKWFNPTKGYGFVQAAVGGGDIFLHASVVRLTGHPDLPPGSRMLCDISDGPRGPQVSAIHSVTLSVRDERPELGGGGRGGGGSDGAGSTLEVEGRVKFFDPARGFGFVVPDDGGQDIFVSVRQLERAGLQSLAPEQRVRLTIGAGRKGPIALSLKLI